MRESGHQGLRATGQGGQPPRHLPPRDWPNAAPPRPRGAGLAKPWNQAEPHGVQRGGGRRWGIDQSFSASQPGLLSTGPTPPWSRWGRCRPRLPFVTKRRGLRATGAAQSPRLAQGPRDALRPGTNRIRYGLAGRPSERQRPKPAQPAGEIAKTRSGIGGSWSGSMLSEVRLSDRSAVVPAGAKRAPHSLSADEASGQKMGQDGQGLPRRPSCQGQFALGPWAQPHGLAQVCVSDSRSSSLRRRRTRLGAGPGKQTPGGVQKQRWHAVLGLQGLRQGPGHRRQGRGAT